MSPVAKAAQIVGSRRSRRLRYGQSIHHLAATLALLFVVAVMMSGCSPKGGLIAKLDKNAQENGDASELIKDFIGKYADIGEAFRKIEHGGFDLISISGRPYYSDHVKKIEGELFYMFRVESSPWFLAARTYEIEIGAVGVQIRSVFAMVRTNTL